MLGVLSDHRAVAGVRPEAGEQDWLPGQRDPPGRPGHHRGGGPGLRGRVWRPLEVLLRPQSPQRQHEDQPGSAPSPSGRLLSRHHEPGWQEQTLGHRRLQRSPEVRVGDAGFE